MNRTENKNQTGMNRTDDWKLIYNAYVNNGSREHRQNLTDLAEALRLATNIKKNRLYAKPEQSGGGDDGGGGGYSEGEEVDTLDLPEGMVVMKQENMAITPPNANLEEALFGKSDFRRGDFLDRNEKGTNATVRLPDYISTRKAPAEDRVIKLDLINPPHRSILKPENNTTLFSSPASKMVQGVKRMGTRMNNNMEYIWGGIEAAMGNESTTQRGMQEIAPRANEYSSIPKERIDSKIDSTIVAGRGVNDETGRLQNEAHQSALEMIASMQKAGFSPEQIQSQIEQYAQQGGPGRQRQQRALEQNQKLGPADDGWGKAGEIGASIAQGLIPIGLAAINPIAGVAAGIANVGLNAAQTGAETSMEVDRYEQQSGRKVPDAQRAGYIAAAMGTEGIIDGVMQGRFLGNVGSRIGKEIGKSSIGSAITNEALRKQALNTAEAFGKNATRGVVMGIAKDAAANAAAGAASSAIQDGAKSIFISPDDLPTLQEIAANAAANAITGAISGAAIGGVGRGINQMQQHNRRRGESSITVGRDLNGKPIEIVGENAQGDLVGITPEGKRGVFSSESIQEVTKLSPFEFDYARKLKELDKRSGVRGDNFFDPNNPPGYAEKRIREMAGNLGIEAKVYPTTGISQGGAKLDVTKPMDPIIMGYFDRGTKEIGVIPDFIENDRTAQRVLMHEKYGHEGIQRITDGHSNSIYEQIHNSLPQEIQQRGLERYGTPTRSGSEYIAKIAESGVVSPNVGDYITGKSRSILRDVTGVKLPYNENDMRYLLWQGSRGVDPSNSLEMMIKAIRGNAEEVKRKKKP